MKHLLFASVAAVALTASSDAPASDIVGLSSVDLRPGWRMQDGSHMAGLHIVLEPGWKTYWRAPGDVGIPPRLDWSNSQNLADLATSWPTPVVFFEQGTRSVGYVNEVVIPMRMTSHDTGAAIQLSGVMQIGVCKDICIPANLSFEATLPPDQSRPDPTILAALTDLPFSASEAGLQSISCTLEQSGDGEMVLRTSIELPSAGDEEHVVVESDNPFVWVAEPESHRDGSTLHATTRLVHVEGKSFAMTRSDLRFTVLGASHAVDIRGC